MVKNISKSPSPKMPQAKKRKLTDNNLNTEKLDQKSILLNCENRNEELQPDLKPDQLRLLLEGLQYDGLSNEDINAKLYNIKVSWGRIQKEKKLHELLSKVKWWSTNETSQFFKEEIASKNLFNYRLWKELLTNLHVNNMDLLSDLTAEKLEEAQKMITRIHIVLKSIYESFPSFSLTFIEIIHLFYPKIIHKPFQVHFLYLKNLLHMTYLKPPQYARLIYVILPHIIQDYSFKMNSNLEPTETKQNFISLLNEILVSIRDFIRNKPDENTIVGLHFYNEFKTAIGKNREGNILYNFILFYLDSIDDLLRKTLLDDHWQIISNSNSLNKCNYVHLISSLIVHATFISNEEIWYCIDLFSMWLHSYLNKLDLKAAEPNVKQHALFYEIFHGLMFIFINRYKELFQHNKGRYFIEGLGIKRIVNSKLNPLLVCDPKLCHYFSELTFFFEFAQCRLIINSNKMLDKKPKYAKVSYSLSFHDPFLVPEDLDSSQEDHPLPLLSSELIAPLYRKSQDLDQPIDFEELEEFLTQSVRPLE